ncbi:MAG: hypothetical protein ACK4NN_12875 [Rheinheimera sp.]
MKLLLNGCALIASLILVTGCNTELQLSGPQVDKFSYEFNHGQQNWQVGFSDYPVEHAEIYELQHGIRPLPTGFQGQGLMISGHNRSDDLFMFMKRRITGLSPSTRYKASLKLNFLSNIGLDCMGIGGSPGEAVFVKFGYAEQEPKQADYYLNVPKGYQSEDGTQAKVIGHFATPGATCDADRYKSKTIVTTPQQALELTTNADGSIWFFIGTDSGFEGLTTIYYRSVELILTPR